MPSHQWLNELSEKSRAKSYSFWFGSSGVLAKQNLHRLRAHSQITHTQNDEFETLPCTQKWIEKISKKKLKLMLLSNPLHLSLNVTLGPLLRRSVHLWLKKADWWSGVKQVAPWHSSIHSGTLIFFTRLIQVLLKSSLVLNGKVLRLHSFVLLLWHTKIVDT